jgi:hypothetical protein
LAALQAKIESISQAGLPEKEIRLESTSIIGVKRVNDTTSELPKRTTPTWEMELLISGALVLSLLSLPAVLDEAVLRLWPKLSIELLSNATIIHMYLRCALFGLSGAFVLHLAIRAYWIALIGVVSVFPHAPDWDNAKGYGKFMRESIRRNWLALSVRIDASDNAASLVFATGIALGAMMLSLSITVFGLGVLGAAFGYAKVFGVGGDVWFTLFAGMLILPLLSATLVDFLAGKYIAFDSGIGKLLLKMLATLRLWPGMAGANAIYQSIRLNLPGRSEKLAFSLLVMLPMLLAIVTTPRIATKIMPSLRPADERSMLLSNPAHYLDQRQGAQLFSQLPFVASREVGQAAVELFLPLNAARLARAQAGCPQDAPAPPASLAMQQNTLICIATAFSLTLDAAAPPQVDVFYSQDARSGLEGIVWRIPNTQFAPGKHLISLADLETNEHDPKSRPPFQILLFR